MSPPFALPLAVLLFAPPLAAAGPPTWDRVRADWEEQRTAVETLNVEFVRVRLSPSDLKPLPPAEALAALEEALDRAGRGTPGKGHPDRVLTAALHALTKGAEAFDATVITRKTTGAPYKEGVGPKTFPRNRFLTDGTRTREEDRLNGNWPHTRVTDGTNYIRRGDSGAGVQTQLILLSENHRHMDSVDDFRFLPWMTDAREDPTVTATDDGGAVVTANGGRLEIELTPVADPTKREVWTGPVGMIRRATYELPEERGGGVFRVVRQAGALRHGGATFPRVLVTLGFREGVLDRLEAVVLLDAAVNDPLPADAFAVSLPAGSDLFDHRGGGDRPAYGFVSERSADAVRTADERAAKR